jgi:hypothetical protein
MIKEMRESVEDRFDKDSNEDKSKDSKGMDEGILKMMQFK